MLREINSIQSTHSEKKRLTLPLIHPVNNTAHLYIINEFVDSYYDLNRSIDKLFFY